MNVPMLNWRIRYQRVLSHNPGLLDQQQSLLEVGGDPRGIAELARRSAVATHTQWPSAPSPWVQPVTASPFSLPFDSNTFDHVVSVDTLHHIAPSHRAQAISELVRVARRKVILSVPCGSLAVDGDLQLAGTFKRMGLQTPAWLQDHAVRSLPSVGDILGMLSGTGHRVEIHTNEALLQHYGGLFLDLFYPPSERIYSMQQGKSDEQVLPAGDWELPYSYLFHLFKEDTVSYRPKPISPTVAANTDQEIGLYAVYHQRLPLAPDTGITPIYVGEAAQEAGADERTETPETKLDNSRWSELSGVHEIWRNGPRSNYVGFCHYRRIFDFTDGNRAAAPSRSALHHGPRSTSVHYDAYLARASGTAARHALQHFENHPNTLVVAPPLKINASVWDEYAVLHNANDLCLLTNLIARTHPYLSPHLATTLSARTLFANNLFITRWDAFEELCNIWFGVLGAFEEQVPVRTHNRYQRRDISFLAERLLDAWVRFRVAEGTRLVTVPILEITYPGLDTTAWSPTASSAPSSPSAPMAPAAPTQGVRP